MIPASLDPARLYDKLAASGVPEHMHTSYVHYILHGTDPGHFLTAVLSNDLKEACNRADQTNAAALYEHVVFLVNHCPIGCWGSPERVRAWVESFQEESA